MRRRLIKAILPAAATTALAAFSAGMTGCAHYSPEALPEKPDDTGAASARVLERAPLDIDAVATLAVLNNPDLNAARARMRVSAAQAFAAGILPEPQMGASLDVPYDNVTSPRDPRYPEYRAYGFTLGVDLQALLTHSSRRASADAAYRQARQEMLWKEWQTIAQARALYVTRSLAEQRHALLLPAAEQYQLEAARSQRALDRHDRTLDDAGADEAALAAIRTQLGTADRDASQAQNSLRLLLGLGPDEPVPLKPLAGIVLPDRAEIAAAADRLAAMRPDLRALQEGYRSAEAQLRTAVLSQFPNVVLGYSRTRDVSDVHSNGGLLSFNLPIFDAARGDIAIQRATREELRAEYLARLDQARADIWSLWDDIVSLRTRLAELELELPILERGAANSRRGFAQGTVPAASYFVAVNALLTAQANRFDLQQALWDDAISLATLTGIEVHQSS